MVLCEILENIVAEYDFFKQGKDIAVLLRKGTQSKITGHDHVLHHQIFL